MSSLLREGLKIQGGQKFAETESRVELKHRSVRLFADASTEESYIEVKGNFDVDEYAQVVRAAFGLGYVLMDEMEDPDAIEEQSDGWVRHYLVLIEVEVEDREEMRKAS